MSLLRQLWYLLRRDTMAAELEEEMRVHREMRAQRLREAGMSDADARTEARRRFGNVTNVTERSRDMWGFASLDQLRQDLRFAARRLRQRPALSVPAIVMLALGIGATTAVFSAVDAAMLRPLPFARAEQLVTLTNVQVPMNVERGEENPGRLVHIGDIAQMTGVFSHPAAYAAGGLNLSDPERPRRVNAGVVTAGFFSTLGARPILGRTFSAEEGRPNGPNAVVLSHALWVRQFGGEDVVGRGIELHGRLYTIVGVMGPGFDFPNDAELWIPMTVPTTWATFEPFRGFLPSQVIARLRPGMTLDQASAAILTRWQQVIAPATPEQRPMLEEWMQEVRAQTPVVPLQRRLLGDKGRALLVLLGATVLLMLIACANVANLLLSDAAARRREIAVREALGASRRRIVRQLLAESTVLATTGGVLGFLLAPGALKVLGAMLPATLAGVAPARLDLRVLAFGMVLAIATAVLFGLWPAVGATRGDATAAIKAGSGHGSTAGGMGKARRVLVVAEVALTVLLLVGAGLMLRSFGRLVAEDTGMRPEQVATLETTFARTVRPDDRRRILDDAVAHLARQPGVTAAGIVNDLPLRGGGGISVTMHVHDAPPGAGPYEDRPGARQLVASAGYFEALGIRLLRGRMFGDADVGRDVAIISKATADAWWPGRDAVGRTMAFGEDGPPIRVIGIVSDVREGKLDADPKPQMYYSAAAQPPVNAALVVRGTLPPAALMARLTEAMRAAAPSQPVYNVRMMEDVIGASVAPRRVNTLLMAVFAGLALLLATAGVYAVVTYAVAQRMREFGIRAALGATGRDLMALVSREMLVVIALGVVAGLLAAWTASSVLRSLLYEVDARDPATFIAVPLVIILPALVATLLPALRAMRVNPVQVMKAD